MPKKITIKDIAKEAGVSYQVVSAILSGKSDTIRFSDATKAKIEGVAKKLNYSPSILARSFQANQSFLIGILGSYQNSFLHCGLIRGAQECLFQKGFSPMFLSHRSSDEEMLNLDHLLERQVDGLVVDTYGINEKTNKRYLDLLNKGLPVLKLFGDGNEQVPCLRQNMFQVGYDATKHLIETGRKRIALFTHERYLQNWDAREQFEGYTRALNEHKIEPRVITLSLSSYSGSNNVLCWYEGAMEMAREILTDTSIDGIISYDVSICYALSQRAKELGINIPESKALVGYHDWDICKISRPTLSSINISPVDLGKSASKMILELIEGKTIKERLVAPHLTVRDSSRHSSK